MLDSHTKFVHNNFGQFFSSEPCRILQNLGYDPESRSHKADSHLQGHKAEHSAKS